MNDTYGEFVGYLDDNINKITESLLMGKNSHLREIYQKPFSENYIRYDSRDFTVNAISATDSSEFVRELYNGKKLILIRSYTKINNEVFNDFKVEVINVDRDQLTKFIVLLMEHSEHTSILNSLRETQPDYVLVDGSLIGRLYHDTNKIKAENYNEFQKVYFGTLGELIDTCIERKIPLVFIAKSSESKIFKNFLLRSINMEKSEAVTGEMKSANTDHYLVRSLADSPGYTTPLVVPINMKWNHDTDKEKLNVVTFHALPRIDDLPIKVDVIVPEAQEFSHERTEKFQIGEKIIDMIFWGYGGLKTHNIWLADIDRLVKFKTKEVEEVYMKTFERKTGIQFYETRGERRARLRI